MGQAPYAMDTTASEEPWNMARLTYSYAVGEQGVVVMQLRPEVSIGLNKRLSFQLKVPFVMASGNLGENSGIGDAIVTASYAIKRTEHTRLTGIGGFRLPTGATSPQPLEQTTFGGDFKPLPMPYQPGLGTLDLLLGVHYRHRRWTAALAYQHVLSQGNENLFYHRAWNGDTDALKYFESLYLERANDAVVRLQYALPFRKLTFQPGLLAIYHLGLDSRLEEMNYTGPFALALLQRRDIAGSDGLTLNLTADARYKIDRSWSIEAAVGSPLVTRTVRPDGLTRALVLDLGLRYSF